MGAPLRRSRVATRAKEKGQAHEGRVTMISKTKTTIDRSTLTITFKRAFDAPREDVFEAWTDPEQIKLWWDPTGTPLADCAVDLRPGGAFCFTAASGHAPPFTGVYR